MKASLAPDDTKMEVHPGYGGLSPGHLNPKIKKFDHQDNFLDYFSVHNLRKVHPGHGGLSPGHLTPCGALRACRCNDGIIRTGSHARGCPPGCW